MEINARNKIHSTVIEGEKIRQVEQSKHLGVTVESKGKFWGRNTRKNKEHLNISWKQRNSEAAKGI